ncbi:SDR family oxidoreductase [Streptomyces sp. NBC_00145]|uniref:SDR family oxidoreductase n=1 Tax=Streptomyces sp. NBC_00145 TaxID=2975666 RepID=UPI002E186528
MDLGLQDKVALVTAAGKGIGLAVGRRLAAEGATVALSSRNADGLKAAAGELGGRVGQVGVFPADLSDQQATADLVDEVVAAHGRLDILVVNTPGPAIKPFLDTTVDDWAGAYDLLVRPAVQLAHAAARHMVEQESGSIVFLTSTWVKQPAPGGVLSAAMRSVLSALSQQMSLELAPRGVRVNQLMPGATGTDRMTSIVAAKAAAHGTTPDEEIAHVVRDIPVGRWAEPEEIADTVAFLASPLSAFTTGSAWHIDGGAVRSTL